MRPMPIQPSLCCFMSAMLLLQFALYIQCPHPRLDDAFDFAQERGCVSAVDRALVEALRERASGRIIGKDRTRYPKSSSAHQGRPPSSVAATPIASASRVRPTGRAKDHRPTAASHAAPRPQPTVKPTIAGQVCFARLRALATSSGSRPSSISPRSIVKRVTLLVITAVDGAPFNEICTRAFCTAIAATPSMPATIALAAFGLRRGPAATQRTRKPARSRNCSSSRGRSEASPIASKPPTSSLVRPSTPMKTGTDSIGANGAAPPPPRCTARMARLPVMCAVSRPPSPRKLMTSTLPVVRLSTLGSSFVPSELSTEGADTQAVLPSASGDIVTHHLLRVDNLVDPLLVVVYPYLADNPRDVKIR